MPNSKAYQYVRLRLLVLGNKRNNSDSVNNVQCSITQTTRAEKPADNSRTQFVHIVNYLLTYLFT